MMYEPLFGLRITDRLVENSWKKLTAEERKTNKSVLLWSLTYLLQVSLNEMVDLVEV
jgi:hypothetical protein